MNAQQASPHIVSSALNAAERTPGWSGRPKDVQAFALGSCTLYVVPARRWINRRQEQQASDTRRTRDIG